MSGRRCGGDERSESANVSEIRPLDHMHGDMVEYLKAGLFRP